MKDEMTANDQLAAYAHDAWSRSVMNIIRNGIVTGSCIELSSEVIERWSKLTKTPFHQLPKEEQKRFKDEALRIQHIFLDGTDD